MKWRLLEAGWKVQYRRWPHHGVASSASCAAVCRGEKGAGQSPPRSPRQERLRWRRCCSCPRSVPSRPVPSRCMVPELAGSRRGCQRSHRRDASITRGFFIRERSGWTRRAVSALLGKEHGSRAPRCSRVVFLCLVASQKSRVQSGRGLKRSPPRESLACCLEWAFQESGQATRSPSASKSLFSCR